MIQIEKLCAELQIGTLTAEITPVYGGFKHKMYAVTTTRGKYAFKMINMDLFGGNIQSAEQHFTRSEQIVNIAAKHIPAVSAKRFNNNIIHDVNGQLFLVFDWIDGKEAEKITPEHSKIIGDILADLHRIDFSEVNIPKETFETKELIDWNFYLQKGEFNNAGWVDLLRKNIDIIYEYYAQAAEASNPLVNKNVISHRNLDYRNVLWNGYIPYVIDWEEAWLVNPLYDFVNTALHWSGYNKDDKEKFLAFSHSYKSKNELPSANWRQILYKRFLEPLDWLEYNLKRSLKINCSDPEDSIYHIEYVINREIPKYAAQIEILEKWLNEI